MPQVDLPAADLGQPLGLVEQGPAALDLAPHPTGPVQLEVGAHPGQQLPAGERLDQVVVGARVEALEHPLLAGTRGEHHHRDTEGERVLLQRREQLETVHPRHHHVGEDQVGHAVPGLGQAVGAVDCRVHPVVPRQQVHHVVPDVGVVVDHEDPRDVLARRASRHGQGLLAGAIGQVRHLLEEALGVAQGGGGAVAAAPCHRPRGDVGRPEGDPHRQGAAHVQHALRGDVAAVQLGELGHQGQPDAGALVGPGGCAVHAVEALEEVRQLAGRNAGAGVGDREDRLVALRAKADRDASGEGELQRVRQQVQHDLGPEVTVDVHLLGERRAVDGQGQSEPLGRGVEHRHQLPRVGGQVEWLEVGLEASGLQPREVQQGVDELQQTLAVAQDHVHPAALTVRQRLVGVGERVLGRPQQERERGPELVADVGEEVGLGPVELGERLGALPLEVEGAGVVDGAGELAGQQLEEVAVAVVERPVPVDAGDQEAVRRRLAALRQGQEDGAQRRLRPAAGGQVGEPALEVVDHDGPAIERGQRGPDRVRAVRHQLVRGGHVLALEARAAGQVGGAGLPVEEVDQRERQVLGGVRELAAGLGQRLVRAELGGRPGTEVAQRAHSPVPDDLLGVLGDHAEHARDRALVVGEWAVGEGVVRLLHVAAALQEQLQRLVPGRLTRAQHVLDARAGVVPDLGPHHRGGLAERPRVLLAEGVAAVGLVAEEGELRAPGHPHGEARGDEHADHRLEAARPPVGRAERRRRPVHGEEVATDLPAALEHRAHARTPPSHPTRAGRAACPRPVRV